jgi:hypothetical protein
MPSTCLSSDAWNFVASIANGISSDGVLLSLDSRQMVKMRGGDLNRLLVGQESNLLRYKQASSFFYRERTTHSSITMQLEAHRPV